MVDVRYLLRFKVLHPFLVALLTRFAFRDWEALKVDLHLVGDFSPSKVHHLEGHFLWPHNIIIEYVMPDSPCSLRQLFCECKVFSQGTAVALGDLDWVTTLVAALRPGRQQTGTRRGSGVSKRVHHMSVGVACQKPEPALHGCPHGLHHAQLAFNTALVKVLLSTGLSCRRDVVQADEVGLEGWDCGFAPARLQLLSSAGPCAMIV